GIDGIDGIDGVDGTQIEYIFKLTYDNARPAIPVNKQEDDFIPVGWTDDAEDVSESYPYMWRSQRAKVNKVWGDFKTPRLVYIKGMDGADGRDGVDYEFIFRRAKSADDVPATPVSVDEDDYVPEY